MTVNVYNVLRLLTVCCPTSPSASSLSAVSLSLFHRLTRTAYIYNGFLPLYNVVLISRVHSQQSQLRSADSCDGGISLLNHCLSWSKLVNTHLYHSSQWFNIHVYNNCFVDACLHIHAGTYVLNERATVKNLLVYMDLQNIQIILFSLVTCLHDCSHDFSCGSQVVTTEKQKLEA